MISYKGQLSFVQYLPKKTHKWGMKAWVLADSLNGYTWGWQLYTGKEDGRIEHGLAHRVVMDLVEDDRLIGKGYIVYTDNFYSSPKPSWRKGLEHVVLRDRIARVFHRQFARPN